MQSLSRLTRARIFFRLSRAPSTLRHASSAFTQSPAPPRLPKEDQDLYERLQRSSTGAFSTPKPTIIVNQAVSSNSSKPQINQSPHSHHPPFTKPEASSTGSVEEYNVDARVQATGEGEELHPDIRRGARPDFEGDRNPETGEVGGPKNEPLRWGGGVDWSYNGRVTDF